MNTRQIQLGPWQLTLAALGLMALTLFAFFSLFNSRHQIRPDRLRRTR